MNGRGITHNIYVRDRPCLGGMSLIHIIGLVHQNASWDVLWRHHFERDSKKYFEILNEREYGITSADERLVWQSPTLEAPWQFQTRLCPPPPRL